MVTKKNHMYLSLKTENFSYLCFFETVYIYGLDIHGIIGIIGKRKSIIVHIGNVYRSLEPRYMDMWFNLYVCKVKINSQGTNIYSTLLLKNRMVEVLKYRRE